MKRSIPIVGMITGAALAAVGVTVALAPALASTADVGDSPGFDTGTEVAGMWPAATAKFPLSLPVDSSWGDAPTFLDSAEGYFQSGFIDSYTATYFRCSWEIEFVRAAEAADEDAKASAIRNLRDFSSLDAVQKYFHGTDEWEKAVVDTAAAGDIEPLATEAQDCSIVEGGESE